MCFETCLARVVLLVMGALAIGCSPSPAPSSRTVASAPLRRAPAVAPSQKGRGGVFVLGGIHQTHERAEKYTHARLGEVFAHLAPDVFCVEANQRFVAYSCKERGLCPSCVAKRSALTAAHLCDAVLPVCPYRQWTLSLPYELRLRLIRDGSLFTAAIRTFVRTVIAWQRRQAKARGYSEAHTGSVTMAQRLGSLLQLTPHAHTWIPDGVFVEDDEGELSFVALPPPTEDDVTAICQRVARRITRLCAADGDDEPFVDEDDAVMASVQAEAVQAPVRRPHLPLAFGSLSALRAS